LKQNGEILPDCVPQGEHEHFAIRFGHASMTGKDTGTGHEWNGPCKFNPFAER
jgi:hypothetical protein